MTMLYNYHDKPAVSIVNPFKDRGYSVLLQAGALEASGRRNGNGREDSRRQRMHEGSDDLPLHDMKE